jgi:hypothetical protein
MFLLESIPPTHSGLINSSTPDRGGQIVDIKVHTTKDTALVSTSRRPESPDLFIISRDAVISFVIGFEITQDEIELMRNQNRG